MYQAYEKLKQINTSAKLQLIDYFQDVTLLFADIVNFTKYSASVRPAEVTFNIILNFIFKNKYDPITLSLAKISIYEFIFS